MADPTHRPLETPSLDSPQEFSGADSTGFVTSWAS